jgi:hypothetical protein
MPDCRACHHCEVLRRGPALEHQCQFTGGEVPDCDCDLPGPCPLELSVSNLQSRIVARTVLLTACRRGMDQLLAEHYGAYQQEQLRALLLAEHLDVAVQGTVVDDVTAQRRWAEALTAGAARA